MKFLSIRALILVPGLFVPAAVLDAQDPGSVPAEQYRALNKEFHEAAHHFSFHAKTDSERAQAVERVEKLRWRLLSLAEKNPKHSIALEALVQVIHQELWLENNTTHSGDGNDSPQVRAIALLLRDHARSDKLGEACRRVRFGFRRECETFLRTIVETNPHREVRAEACLRLAQFLNGRLHRLDLVRERPELAQRYEKLFGKVQFERLLRQDRAEVAKEALFFFERAVEQYGDVKLLGGGTVAEQVKSELFEIRRLTVGKAAPDIEGVDQDGKPFKLSEYRGKVVLLYFWSEF